VAVLFSDARTVSVHKSQGSEYPCVIIPLLTQQYVLLQRNLVYTALTGGKKLVIVVGSKKAMAIAVKDDRMLKPYTYLSEPTTMVFSGLPMNSCSPKGLSTQHPLH
jgi:superfamily I DNA and RNA helicase